MASAETGESTTRKGGDVLRGLCWVVVGFLIALLATWIRGLDSLSEIISIPLTIVLLLVGMVVMLIGVFKIPTRTPDSWYMPILVGSMLAAMASIMVGVGFFAVPVRRMVGLGDVEGSLGLGVIFLVAGVSLLLLGVLNLKIRLDSRTKRA